MSKLKVYNVKKADDVQLAFWDDNLFGNRGTVLRQQLKLDKLRAKAKEKPNGNKRRKSK
jgi:hypothetical protein